MERLLNKAIEGDKEAFSLIFLELQSDLYKIAISKTGNKEDALDAIQETMIITYKNMKKIKEKSSIKSWIMRVLINECYKIYNKKNKSKIIFFQDNNVNEDIEYYNLASEKIQNSNMNFNELIEELNEKEKIIMILYYKNQYTTKEISKILKIKENTIKSIIKRARNKIKDNLKGENYEGLYM